jgi:uncharacterized membrane protein
MSDLVVITFPNETDGPAALAAIRGAQKGGGLSIKDAACVVKDASGKINTRNETDSTTIAGGVGGGAIGLLLGLVFFPVGGLIIGATVGALIGKSLHHNVDKQLVKDVTDDLTPSTSAVFVLVDANPAALVGAVRQFNGKVYQSSLDEETESQLEEALKSHGG